MLRLKLKVSAALVMLCCILSMAGCPTLQSQWNNLTPDEQGRIVIGGMQAQLDTLFDTGKSFVVQNPQYQDKWQSEIVPSFNVANNAIRTYATLMAQGKTDVATVIKEVTPLMDAVKKLLQGIGVRLPTGVQ